MPFRFELNRRSQHGFHTPTPSKNAALLYITPVLILNYEVVIAVGARLLTLTWVITATAPNHPCRYILDMGHS